MSARKEKKLKKCQICDNVFVENRGKVFCSKRCSKAHLLVFYEKTCQHCGKVFFVKNISYLNRGDYNYCSRDCSKKKFKFREHDFTKLDSETVYWLGYLFATVTLVEEAYVVLHDVESQMIKFLEFMNSNIQINKKEWGCSISVFSRKLSRDLLIAGIRLDHYKEAPLLPVELVKDFIRGYFDSNRGYIYHEQSRNIVAIHGEDSKLMRYFADMLNAQIVYKAGEWIVVCQNFEFTCNGFPRNEKKWKRFKFFPESS